jgi:hypothetical protein
MNKMLFIAAFCCATSIAGAQEFRELQDSHHNVIGYIGPSATVLNKNKEFIGQYKNDGRGESSILDRHHQIVGHLVQGMTVTFKNAKNETLGTMSREGVFENAEHQVVGYIKQDGTVEDKNHAVIGYEMNTEAMWAGPYYFFSMFK